MRLVCVFQATEVAQDNGDLLSVSLIVRVDFLIVLRLSIIAWCWIVFQYELVDCFGCVPACSFVMVAFVLGCSFCAVDALVVMVFSCLLLSSSSVAGMVVVLGWSC